MGLMVFGLPAVGCQVVLAGTDPLTRICADFIASLSAKRGEEIRMRTVAPEFTLRCFLLFATVPLWVFTAVARARRNWLSFTILGALLSPLATGPSGKADQSKETFTSNPSALFTVILTPLGNVISWPGVNMGLLQVAVVLRVQTQDDVPALAVHVSDPIPAR